MKTAVTTVSIAGAAALAAGIATDAWRDRGPSPEAVDLFCGHTPVTWECERIPWATSLTIMKSGWIDCTSAEAGWCMVCVPR